MTGTIEALHLDRHVIRVGREVAEDVPAGRIGRRGFRETADRVGNLHLDRLHHAAGRIFHDALQRACAAETLRPDIVCSKSSRFEIRVVQAFRPARSGRPNGLHYT